SGGTVGAGLVVSLVARSRGGVQNSQGVGAVPATPRTPGGLVKRAAASGASAASARAPIRRVGEGSLAVIMLSSRAPVSAPFIRTRAMGCEAHPTEASGLQAGS